MTTDRDTLREKIFNVVADDVGEAPDWTPEWAEASDKVDEIMQLIDAHDNALKERLMDTLSDGLDDIKGSASKQYYPLQGDERRLEHIYDAVGELEDAINQVFSKGGER